MADDATVRAARPGDGHALVRLHEEMAAYYADLAPSRFVRPDVTGLADTLDAEFATTSDAALHLVAEIRGDVAGVLYAHLVRPHAGAHREMALHLRDTRVRIDYLATATAYRRRGVATRLVDAAEEWGRRSGATIAETSTYVHSPLSVPFWTERVGYEHTSMELARRL
jgi:GNAT superfamily N-acetyltransferase